MGKRKKNNEPPQHSSAAQDISKTQTLPSKGEIEKTGKAIDTSKDVSLPTSSTSKVESVQQKSDTALVTSAIPNEKSEASLLKLESPDTSVKQAIDDKKISPDHESSTNKTKIAVVGDTKQMQSNVVKEVLSSAPVLQGKGTKLDNTIVNPEKKTTVYNNSESVSGSALSSDSLSSINSMQSDVKATHSNAFPIQNAILTSSVKMIDFKLPPGIHIPPISTVLPVSTKPYDNKIVNNPLEYKGATSQDMANVTGDMKNSSIKMCNLESLKTESKVLEQHKSSKLIPAPDSNHKLVDQKPLIDSHIISDTNVLSPLSDNTQNCPGEEKINKHPEVVSHENKRVPTSAEKVEAKNSVQMLQDIKKSDFPISQKKSDNSSRTVTPASTVSEITNKTDNKRPCQAEKPLPSKVADVKTEVACVKDNKASADMTLDKTKPELLSSESVKSKLNAEGKIVSNIQHSSEKKSTTKNADSKVNDQVKIISNIQHSPETKSTIKNAESSPIDKILSDPKTDISFDLKGTYAKSALGGSIVTKANPASNQNSENKSESLTTSVNISPSQSQNNMATNTLNNNKPSDLQMTPGSLKEKVLGVEPVKICCKPDIMLVNQNKPTPYINKPLSPENSASNTDKQMPALDADTLGKITSESSTKEVTSLKKLTESIAVTETITASGQNTEKKVTSLENKMSIQKDKGAIKKEKNIEKQPGGREESEIASSISNNTKNKNTFVSKDKSIEAKITTPTKETKTIVDQAQKEVSSQPQKKDNLAALSSEKIANKESVKVTSPRTTSKNIGTEDKQKFNVEQQLQNNDNSKEVLESQKTSVNTKDILGPAQEPRKLISKEGEKIDTIMKATISPDISKQPISKPKTISKSDESICEVPFQDSTKSKQNLTTEEKNKSVIKSECNMSKGVLKQDENSKENTQNQTEKSQETTGSKKSKQKEPTKKVNTKTNTNPETANKAANAKTGNEPLLKSQPSENRSNETTGLLDIVQEVIEVIGKQQSDTPGIRVASNAVESCSINKNITQFDENKIPETSMKNTKTINEKGTDKNEHPNITKDDNKNDKEDKSKNKKKISENQKKLEKNENKKVVATKSKEISEKMQYNENESSTDSVQKRAPNIKPKSSKPPNEMDNSTIGSESSKLSNKRKQEGDKSKQLSDSNSGICEKPKKETAKNKTKPLPNKCPANDGIKPLDNKFAAVDSKNEASKITNLEMPQTNNIGETNVAEETSQEVKKKRRRRNRGKKVTATGNDDEIKEEKVSDKRNNKAEIKSNLQTTTKSQVKDNIKTKNTDEKSKANSIKKVVTENKNLQSCQKGKTVTKNLSEEQLTHITKTAVNLSQSLGDSEKSGLGLGPDVLRSLLAPKPANLLSSAEEEELEYRFVQRQVFLSCVCHVCKVLGSSNCNLKKCNDCKLISYCSKKHQKDHWPAHKDICKVISTICKRNGMINLYQKAVGISPNEYRNYRNRYVSECSVELGRELELWEKEMLYYPQVCHTCYEFDNQKLTTCKKCQQVSYCKPEHLKPDHDVWCKEFEIYRDITLYQFRHGMIQPPIPEKVFQQYAPLTGDMKSFIYNTLVSDKSLQMSNEHFVALTDIATCPLTILFSIQKCNLNVEKLEALTINLVGAEIYFEVDTIKKWELLLLHLLPSIKSLTIAFIGPELKVDNALKKTIEQNKMCSTCNLTSRKVSYEFWPGVYHDFIKSDKYQKPTLIAAFNSGMYRSSDFEGKDTWFPTIEVLFKDSDIPVIITEYTDKELPLDIQRIQDISGPIEIIQPPVKNPFTSSKPSLNFLSEEDVPVIFKNYYMTVIKKIKS